MTSETEDRGPGQPDKIARMAARMDPPGAERPAKAKKEKTNLLDEVPLTLRQQMKLLPLPGLPMKVEIDGQLTDVEPGAWRVEYLNDENGLPVNCPVTPLGSAGNLGSYFLTPLGNLYLLKPSAPKGEIRQLFAPFSRYLLWAWGRTNVGQSKAAKFEIVDGFHAEIAAEDLMDAAACYGSFDPQGVVRGRGCWRDGKSLVYHAGDAVLLDGVWHKPGRIGDYIYPSKRAIGRPRHSNEGWQAAEAIIELLQTFNWERPDIDPELMFGWMISARMAAALKVRPIMWLNGQEGAGKSALFDLLKSVMNRAIVAAQGATAANIYQTLKEDVLAVILDEQEAETDTRNTDNIIKLARISYSGGTLGRGGAEGMPVNYELRASFFCSSIVRPSMNAQDESRMISLMISPLEDGNKGGTFDFDEIAEQGEILMGRVFQRWPDFDGIFRFAHDFLRANGFDARGADTLGTVIACHHIGRYDRDLAEDDMREWVKKCPPPAKTVTWQRMVQFMLETRPEYFRDPVVKDKSVDAVISSLRAEISGNSGDLFIDAINAANKKVREFGMFFELAPDRVGSTKFEDVELFVPNGHSGMRSLFAGSQWAGNVGAQGPWAGVLKQAAKQGVARATDKPVKKNNDRSVRGHFIHLKKAMDSFE